MVLRPPQQAPAARVVSVPDLPEPQEPQLSLIPADVSQQSPAQASESVTRGDGCVFTSLSDCQCFPTTLTT